MSGPRPTGQQLLELARAHIGERYVLGAFAPKNAADWRGPWDCAELASWVVYQVSRILYGVHSANDDPERADAYTGYWARDVRIRGTPVTVAEATLIPGAFVLRSPAERRGHIVVSDGLGGTVEAHSAARGVCASVLQGRIWTTGILVPGIDYAPPGAGGG